MPLFKRLKTWSVRDESAASSDQEHSDSGSQEQESLRSAQQEAKRQAMLYEAQVHELQKESKRRFFFKARFLFPLGVILGVLLGFILIQPHDIQEMHAHLLLLIQEYDISLRLPEIDFSRVEVEWGRLRSNIPEVWKLNNDGREFQAGEALKERGLTAQYPVVVIPGIISTSLESWSTSPEYRPFFREKVWGGFNMLSQVVFNRERWMAAMMLDPDTGLDTPGAKVRAAEGINAASNFMTGYWIWAKIIENLAVVDYDTNNLYLAAYDWRLSMWNLEERDGYFSRLKVMIEGLKKRQGKKVVLAAHSMGATVALYFNASFKWVESPAHGGGGPDWVENHIETFLSIAGSYLGTAKAMTAFLSGEMRDTVEMNPAGAYGQWQEGVIHFCCNGLMPNLVLERFFSRSERQQLFRSWAGSASLWVKGGDTIWGNETWAPDDGPEASHSHGALISFRGELILANNVGVAEQTKNMTAEMVGNWILERTPSSFQKMLSTNYSFGIERDEEVLARNDFDYRKWTNPLEIRLPNAPSMKFICAYGHGKETERSYWYAHAQQVLNESVVDTEPSKEQEAELGSSTRPASDYTSRLRSSWIDAEYTNVNLAPRVRNGVNMGEGDGTVSLLSMGAMCVEGWKRPRWNPARINVTTVELPHRPVPNIPRGGANTGDHVDILGSTALNEIILKIATGVGHEIEETFVSRIREYAQDINWD